MNAILNYQFYNDEMQKETVSKICKKFTCSEPDKNGVINITNKK